MELTTQILAIILQVVEIIILLLPFSFDKKGEKSHRFCRYAQACAQASAEIASLSSQGDFSGYPLACALASIEIAGLSCKPIPIVLLACNHTSLSTYISKDVPVFFRNTLCLVVR